MDRAAIIDMVAPCGLDCRKCLARKGGDIQTLSAALGERLGEFGRYAERFAGYDPAFGGYPQFRTLLDRLAAGTCSGCRAGGCIHPGCAIRPCVLEKGVDFCYECAEFPCDRADAMPELKERWARSNARMREAGPEAYCRELQDRPRYG
jgi:hypothetical protein